MKSKVIDLVKPTISTCKEELANGNIGQIEYHLFKDNTWTALPFTSLKDKHEKVKQLEHDGYDYDKVIYFEHEIYKLENPQLNHFDYITNLTNYLQSIM